MGNTRSLLGNKGLLPRLLPSVTVPYYAVMEDEEEDLQSLSKTSSTVTLTQHNVSISRTSSKSTILSSETIAQANANLPNNTGISQCQIVTHQASGDSLESEESHSVSTTSANTRPVSPGYSLLSKSPHSSSSQEDYDPRAVGQYLTAGVRTETAKSMESLRTHQSRSYLSTSDRDIGSRFSQSVETKSMDHLEREMRLKRYAVSGEETTSGSTEDSFSAERRRGLWSGRSRAPQHLSLPPPAGYLNLSPGDRKLTILSPHSPLRAPDYMRLTSQSMFKTSCTSSSSRSRSKRTVVMPRLVLPRSDSEISDVFSEHFLE